MCRWQSKGEADQGGGILDQTGLMAQSPRMLSAARWHRYGRAHGIWDPAVFKEAERYKL